MSKIKIALFVDTFYPKIDGVTRVVDNYARVLNSYDDVDCRVFCPKVQEGYIDSFSYNVIRCESLPFVASYRIPTPDLSSAPKVAFKDFMPDIVHSHSPFTLGHYGLELAKKYKIPYVTTFHSKYYEDFLQQTHSKAISKLLVDYIVHYYNQADAVWTVGPSTAETLREYGYKGEITIVDNATTMFYPENPDECRELLAKHFNIPKTGKVLLFVGRITKQKNLYFMLDTMRFIKDKDIKLIVVGDGEELKALKKYAAKNGISDSIFFTGEISNQMLLKSFYLESDLFFFPSTYDTSTLVAREAAALKVPTLMLRGCNSADLIVENQNGFLCNENPQTAAAEIESILSSPELLKKVGETASKTIGLSWEQRMPEVLERYREIIKNYNK